MTRPNNPYRMETASEESGFVGRSDVFDTVESELRSPERSAVVLLGQRRMGKTATLRELVAHLPGGVCLLGEDGTLVTANDLAHEHLRALTDRPVAVGSALASVGGRPVLELLEAAPGGLSHELEVTGPPRRVFVTHGEAVPADTLRHLVQDELGVPAHVPDYREVAQLT